MTVNRLAIPDEQERTPRSAAEWLWPLLPIGVSMFCMSALVYYHLRHDVIVVSSTLQNAIAGIYGSIGFAPAVVFFLLVLTWSSIWFATGSLERPVGRVLRLLAMTVMLGVALNLGDGGVASAFHKGELGAWLASMLVAAFGYYPSLVLVWVVMFGSLLLATDFFFSESFERLRPRSHPVDTGVETAVTDHLKGLAGPPEAAQVQPAALRADAEPPALVSRGSPARPVETVDSEVVVEPEIELPDEPLAGGSWRRSYFERRHDEEHNAGSVDEGWVPMAPDAQEIDNPEIVPETVPNAGIDAPVPAETIHAADPEQLRFDEVENVPATGPGPADLPTTVDEVGEPLVTIPRPEGNAGRSEVEDRATEDRQAPERIVPLPPPADARQQSLFGRGLDDDLVEEAAAVVREANRASAALLQRKLRIDYAEACRVLAELAARGLVELDADPSHGRVIGS